MGHALDSSIGSGLAQPRLMQRQSSSRRRRRRSRRGRSASSGRSRSKRSLQWNSAAEGSGRAIQSASHSSRSRSIAAICPSTSAVPHAARAPNLRPRKIAAAPSGPILRSASSSTSSCSASVFFLLPACLLSCLSSSCTAHVVFSLHLLFLFGMLTNDAVRLPLLAPPPPSPHTHIHKGFQKTFRASQSFW